MAILSQIQDIPISKIIYYSIAVYVASTIVVVIPKLFFHPLSRVPSPMICATSRLYEFWWDSIHHVRLWTRMPKLHEEYGRTPQELGRIHTENLLSRSNFSHRSQRSSHS